jgi:hypothetical protein
MAGVDSIVFCSDAQPINASPTIVSIKTKKALRIISIFVANLILSHTCDAKRPADEQRWARES